MPVYRIASGVYSMQHFGLGTTGPNVNTAANNFGQWQHSPHFGPLSYQARVRAIPLALLAPPSAAILPADSVADSAGEVTWAELEVPFLDAAGEVAWAELEVPTADSAAEISFSELEVPTADSDAEIAQAELEVPSALVDAAGEVAQTELEVPTADSDAEVAQAEFEVPDVAVAPPAAGYVRFPHELFS